MTNFNFKRFDIYRKVPKDLTQPTVTGAIISIICVTTVFTLFVSEMMRYLSSEIISEVYVDNPGAGERIPVSLTIELPRLSCKYVGLDIQDNMGRHEVGFVDNTVKDPMNNGAGCKFHSTFQINKVPGNFHVSTHAADRPPDSPDFSHNILEIKLGDTILAHVPGSFDPLKNISKESSSELLGFESHDYIMKLVPTIYEPSSGTPVISYQYTYAYRSFVGRGSAIWFRYDIAPLTVRYKEKRQSFFSFIIAMCAVIGGVFTVANMIDGIIFSATELYKKFELGKLS